jgi:Rho-binding antiterminator
MNTYQPLNCDLHDFLEIACMHGYRLQVELIEGPSFVARALDTRTAPSKEEFLVLQTGPTKASRRCVSTSCWPSPRSTPAPRSAGWSWPE